MTLQAACIQKTRDLLTSGAWDECEENPFLRMPPSVVEELLSRLRPEGSERSVAHFRLLLTSGRLEHVTLTHAWNAVESIALLQMLCRGSRNLRTLHVGSNRYPEGNVDEERALRNVLLRSTKLRHLHSGIRFALRDLRNCSHLKTVRLHFGAYGAIERFLRGVTSDLWKGPRESRPLRSVEVLAMCSYDAYLYRDRRTLLIPKIAMLLDNCPRLTSLGFLESSEALCDRACGTARRFQLRRCFWGYEGSVDRSKYSDRIRLAVQRTCGTSRWFQLRRRFWRHESSVDRPKYCERIRLAVQSCPLVEVLAMEVFQASALGHLNALSNLTSLSLDLFQCEDDPMPEFFSLLHHVGPRLRHLCVSRVKGSLNLNALDGTCPNLTTLQVDPCSVTADEGLRLPNLQRLSTDIVCDRGSLIALLSSCPRLRVLCMTDASCFEDDDLQATLRKTSFAELEVAIIYYCSLSESGWRRLLRSASRLRSCYLHSDILGDDVVEQCAKDLNPSVVCHHRVESLAVKAELFSWRVFSSCFL